MIDAALAVSALLMGAAGGPHCAAMCGAAQAGVVGACGQGSARPAALALQLGRVVGYAAAGALVAGGIALLGAAREAAAVVGPLWRLLHVAAIAFGGWLLWTGRQPAWWSDTRPAPDLAGGVPMRIVRGGLTTTDGHGAGEGHAAREGGAAGARSARMRRDVRAAGLAGAAGAAWVAVPCGLLQAALVTAALASGPAAGAVVMASFALASAVSLQIAPILWRRLVAARGDDARAVAPFVRLAGALLVAASAYALARDIGKSLGAAWCA